jgi:hypothetical protein
MTVDSFSGPVTYAVSGTGPYAVPWDYTTGALRVVVPDGDAEIVLGGADYTVAPASGASGDVTLSPAAAAAHAGRAIVIGRRTVIEQGWAGQEARERGLEANIDRLAMSVQDQNNALDRTLKFRVLAPDDLPAPEAGRVLMGTSTGYTNGPLASDVAAAQANAAQAVAAAGAAAASAGSASGSAGAAASSAASASGSAGAAASSAGSASGSAGAAASSAASASGSAGAAAASAAEAAFYASVVRQTFTTDAGNAYILTVNPIAASHISVWLGGVRQFAGITGLANDYTVTVVGGVATLSLALPITGLPLIVEYTVPGVAMTATDGDLVTINGVPLADVVADKLDADLMVGTVSETGGVPTGAIIERGTNTNGTYVRWADGTQMCWHKSPVLTCNASAIGATGLSTSGAYFLTFPALFAASPFVTEGATRVGGSHSHFAMKASGASDSSPSQRAFQLAAVTGGSGTIDMVAHGRWY